MVKRIPKKKSDDSNEDYKKRAVRAIKNKNFFNIFLSLVLLVVVFAAASMIYLNTAEIDASSPALILKAKEFNDRFFPGKEVPAAVVNEEIISMEELDARYDLIPEAYRTIITKQDILGQMIDEELLIQEAAEKGITASKEEIDSQIGILLIENQMTREDLLNLLDERGLSLEEMEGFYEQEIILTKLLNETVVQKINITEEMIEQYYENNLEEFRSPLVKNVSHILICHNESERCQSELSKESALNAALDIRENLTPENFAETAFKRSYEPAAVVTRGNLGWVAYTDGFDKTFLNHTFSLEDKEISEPVETEFGYHLIIVYETRPEQILNLIDVSPQIYETLRLEEQNRLFGEYLESLKKDANIINYLG